MFFRLHRKILTGKMIIILLSPILFFVATRLFVFFISQSKPDVVVRYGVYPDGGTAIEMVELNLSQCLKEHPQAQMVEIIMVYASAPGRTEQFPARYNRRTQTGEARAFPTNPNPNPINMSERELHSWAETQKKDKYLNPFLSGRYRLPNQ